MATLGYSVKFDLKDPPLWSKDEISRLDEESQKLLNHKCKFKIGENGVNLTFMPTPYLYDDNGNYNFDKDPAHSDQVNHNYRRFNYEYSRKSLRWVDAGNLAQIDHICSQAVRSMNCDKIESTFVDQDAEKYKGVKLLESGGDFSNGFIRACEIAWAEHYPLRIDPSHIWLCITQAVALHVDKNGEKLREKWVVHEGKKQLIVVREEFVKGNRKNDWSGVIDEFCDQIDKNTVKDSVSLLEADFSNATKIDKINAKITIMDICKNYFEYLCCTHCGFPRITLTGTKQDWVKIYNKSEKLLKEKVEPEFGKTWRKALLPILQRFIIAFDGKIDCLFWNSMIKRGAHYGSGGFEWYSGWINTFFPLIQGSMNQFCVPYESSCDYIQSGLKKAGYGKDVKKYSIGLSLAPVIWQYSLSKYKLKFIGGFLGVTRDVKKGNELSAMTGWVIGEQTKENEQQVEDMQIILENTSNIIEAKPIQRPNICCQCLSYYFRLLNQFFCRSFCYVSKKEDSKI